VLSGNLKKDVFAGIMFFNATSVVELAQYQEAQGCINEIYKVSAKTDPVYYKTLQLQNTYFIKMISNPNTPNGKVKELKHL